jgi:hypothetical protein
LVGEVDSSQPEDVKRAVVIMSKHIFAKLRLRIIKNTVLKVYSFVLVPCQSSLWSVLQAAVSSLSDDELRKRFDVVSTVQKLQSTEKSLLDRVEELKSTRAEISKWAAQYNL